MSDVVLSPLYSSARSSDPRPSDEQSASATTNFKDPNESYHYDAPHHNAVQKCREKLRLSTDNGSTSSPSTGRWGIKFTIDFGGFRCGRKITSPQGNVPHVLKRNGQRRHQVRQKMPSTVRRNTTLNHLTFEYLWHVTA
ncbi:hypothetical protein ZHAS_00003548 [Anopheles sinensis]|uniref:Uncharacterized protein n=1 Tax=Anopheles sinensis TaxID=74873 RepID=A0A084VEJ1_ANOSI|nr:hypothetical protein ZHAS_00003548 [Anopheles sinensis]